MRLKRGRANDNSFAAELAAARERLQATEKEMATCMNIKVDTYRALAAGRNLPAPALKALRRRLEKALEMGRN